MFCHLFSDWCPNLIVSKFPRKFVWIAKQIHEWWKNLSSKIGVIDLQNWKKHQKSSHQHLTNPRFCFKKAKTFQENFRIICCWWSHQEMFQCKCILGKILVVLFQVSTTLILLLLLLPNNPSYCFTIIYAHYY